MSVSLSRLGVQARNAKVARRVGSFKPHYQKVRNTYNRVEMLEKQLLERDSMEYLCRRLRSKLKEHTVVHNDGYATSTIHFYVLLFIILLDLCVG